MSVKVHRNEKRLSKWVQLNGAPQFAIINKNISHNGQIFGCFFFMIFIVCGYFPRLSFFRFVFLDSGQVENFIGSDPCPNCLQGYKQRTLPKESAKMYQSKWKCIVGIVHFSN